MLAKRRKEILLGVVLAILGIVVYRTFLSAGTSPKGPTPSNQRRGAGAQARSGQSPAAIAAPDVKLELLEGERPAPIDAERNVFRYKPKAPPPPPPSAFRPPPTSVSTPAPAAPSGPPPPPPITLKFIGVVEQPGTKLKMAVLTDGLGPPMTAVEGATVGGRYRVIRIGVESIELSYLDGRGRQTIRLTGGS